MSKNFKPELGEVYMTSDICLGETMCSSPSIDYLDYSDRGNRKSIQAQGTGFGWEIGDYSSFDGKRFIVSLSEVTPLRKLLEHLESLIE
jgi:hypothetical protein